MKYQGLRIITNLHCNYRCRYCYQKDKSVKELPLSVLVKILYPYLPANGATLPFEYCTIMGGESTLLDFLNLYIEWGALVSPQVRLTTNGSMLTEERLRVWKRNGLTGVNVSVPIMGKQYPIVTGSNVSFQEILKNIVLVRTVFGADQTRVNIPLCRQNMQGNELVELLRLFTKVAKIKVTICEDILETYSIRDNPERYGLKLIKDTGHGLLLYDFEGREVGCYAHKDNYKETDLIVSPVGVFSGWDDYCKTVGLNPKH